MHENSTESGPPHLEEDLNELRFSHTQNYFDRSLTIRLLIGLVFFLFLFLFLHFREVYVEKIELGKKADHYVISEVDFTFPDEEATLIFRQEAAHHITGIYKIKEEAIQKKIGDFQKYVTEEEQGIRDWERLTHATSVEEVTPVLNLIASVLTHARFTTLKTIRKLEEIPPQSLPVSITDFYPYSPMKEKARLPIQFWSTLARSLNSQKIPLPLSFYVLSDFEKVQWPFEQDLATEGALKRSVQGTIPQLYTQVRAGERLFDKDQVVTARHVAMLQAMREKMEANRHLFDPITLVGTLLTTLLFIGMGAVYLKENHRDIFYSNRKLALVVTILLLSFFFAKTTELFLVKNTNTFIEFARFALFVPIAAILLSSLLHTRIAVFGIIFLTISLAMILPVDAISFSIINIFTSMTAILSIRAIRRRKEVFFICGRAWIGALLVIIAFHLYEHSFFTTLFIRDFLTTLIFMLLTAILVVGLIPILESIFQILTDITLMEFMDPTNELLRQLTLEAPGTYQHSIIVGHLAEAAASAIGANGLFCRVATQYHDIGKLANPQYFTENQLGGVDLHQLLTPLESAQVIIAHVSEGVALARKKGLPEQFISIIKEHHGTTLVYYFYHKQLELASLDPRKINERDFRYSGPRPRTKESTIIMVADTLEAASRSLDFFNRETITDLVELLIAQKMKDGQFDESLLTLEELSIVKATLVKTLLAASHPRIKYPPHHPGEEG